MSTTIFRSIAACDIGKNDSQIRALLPDFWYSGQAVLSRIPERLHLVIRVILPITNLKVSQLLPAITNWPDPQISNDQPDPVHDC
jgi:uncharacterized protein YqiB (DUF1249 family)